MVVAIVVRDPVVYVLVQCIFEQNLPGEFS
jgi:hypothetical protein